MSPYGLAKKYKKRTLKLYIIPPTAGVAYVPLTAYAAAQPAGAFSTHKKQLDKVMLPHPNQI